jgi:hypothetical protein
VSPLGVALLPPDIATVVIATALPEAGAILLHEAQAPHPLGALPQIELGHYQPQGLGVFWRQILAVVLVGEEDRMPFESKNLIRIVRSG